MLWEALCRLAAAVHPRSRASPPQRGKKRRKRKDADDDKDHEERAHEEATKIKNVQRIQFGKYMIDTWYYSPFPQVRRRRRRSQSVRSRTGRRPKEIWGWSSTIRAPPSLQLSRND